MTKFLSLLFLLFSLVFFIKPASALAANSFVSVVNPVRGSDFWDQPNQKPQDAVMAQEQILKKYSIPATWLVRYDALKDPNIISALKSAPVGDEYGIFFEVTPTLTGDSGVKYHQAAYWHSAASVFLSGYSLDERKKLIDNAFGQFKKQFGFYPKSVGAWWIDSYSLDYMSEKYGVIASLEVADQYSTDDYQIWGQYFGSPYIPARQNVLFPAQQASDSMPVVMTQWASRDPVNGYGNGVAESTYSVQPNDYMDYHSLDSDYFSKLVDIYTNQPQNQVNQLSVGLENSYSWQKYGGEYDKEMAILSAKRSSRQFNIQNMAGFAGWYLNRFPVVSPEQIIIANDPLGSSKKTIWYMNPYYRLGWFYANEGSVIRDVRQYVSGQEELCLKVVCNSVNFATTATRVLDDVSFGQHLLLDPGSISGFDLKQTSEGYTFSYVNSAGNKREVALLKRDIGIDGKISSVDTFILNALAAMPPTNSQYALQSNPEEAAPFKEGIGQAVLIVIKFILFLILALLLPGYFLLGRAVKKALSVPAIYFLSFCLGMVLVAVVSYIFAYLHALWVGALVLLLIDVYSFFKGGWRGLLPGRISLGGADLAALAVIVVGVILQLIPVVRTGVVYDYGMGFWGASSHDGMWHLSLANSLLHGLPVQNPALSGEVLKNYHFLFDLLLAVTHQFSAVPLTDLLFRAYPILLSVSLGVGSYVLANKLFKSKVMATLSLFFVYFSGSFGWIATYLAHKVISGESAFWANQMVSFNFNPPFAISLIILIAFVLLFICYLERASGFLLALLIMIAGSLVGFKSYAGMLVIGALFFVSAINFLKKGNRDLLKLFIGSALFSLLFILPNFTLGVQFFVFSPLWLVHSMIDDPDRVGWLRLSMARLAYHDRGQWLKYILTETAGLAIFVAGNLGMKVWGGGYLFLAKLEQTSLRFFLLALSLLSIAVPLIFIQAGNSWNIVQFFYYFMYLAALFSGPALYLFYKKVPKMMSLPILLIVLVLTPINAIASANMYTGKNPHTFISPVELGGLTFLAKQPYGVVLSMPFDKNVRANLSDPVPLFAYDTTAYVSAFSEKPTYLEDTNQQDILQTDYLKRLVTERDFFAGGNPQKQKDFLKNANIRYIYVLKYFNISLDEKGLGLVKILDNKDVSVYEVAE